MKINKPKGCLHLTPCACLPHIIDKRNPSTTDIEFKFVERQLF